MTVEQLRKLLSCYDKNDTVIFVGNIKIIGKYSDGIGYEEFINSAGGVWEGGCGTAPNGTFCGECSTFDCEQCDWRERK